MKKILISQETEKIEQLKEDLLSALPLVQSVWVEWIKTEFFNEAFTLSQVFTQHKNAKQAYLLNLVREELGENSKLLLNEPKLLELYKLPPSPAFDNAILEAENFLNQAGIKTSSFVTVDTTVKINDNTVSAIVDSCSLYAESPEEIKLYKLLQRLIKDIQDMNEFTEKNQLGVFAHKLHPIQIRRWGIGWIEEKHAIDPKIFRALKFQLGRKQRS